MIKNKLTGSFYRFSSWPLFVVMLIVFLFLGNYQETHPVGLKYLEQMSGVKSLDTSSYSATEVYPRLEAYDKEWAAFYGRLLFTWDFFFPVLFRLTEIILAFVMLKMWLEKGHLLYLTAMLPLISMGLDIIENSLIVLMLSQLPNRIALLPGIVSFLTPCKWIFNYIEWTSLGILFVLSIVMKIKNMVKRRAENREILRES